jgi:peptide/nickel transport system substrate-binding protein
MTELESKLGSAAKLAGQGKLSRRDFVQLALATGLTVTAANAMFVSAVRAEPKKGGTLKIGLAHGATTDSLDPGLYYDQFTGTACWGTLSNSLTEIDAKGNAVPDLAESFEPADGAAKWVFKIRKGVTFHNGKTVNSDDVVASIKHHSVEGTKSAAKSLLAAVKDVKADGPTTVIFELAGGNGPRDVAQLDVGIYLPGDEFANVAGRPGRAFVDVETEACDAGENARERPAAHRW